jgi:hypothetical protein
MSRIGKPEKGGDSRRRRQRTCGRAAPRRPTLYSLIDDSWTPQCVVTDKSRDVTRFIIKNEFSFSLASSLSHTDSFPVHYHHHHHHHLFLSLRLVRAFSCCSLLGDSETFRDPAAFRSSFMSISGHLGGFDVPMLVFLQTHSSPS